MAVFDREAHAYDAWYDTEIGGFVDKVEKQCAFSLFQLDKGLSILDIGCGTGNYSIQLAEMGYKVIAIDVSDEMLNIAREKAKGKGLDIEFYTMSVYDLEFEDDSFDSVFSMAAFEFIEDTHKALNEIFRVVKTGGDILIGTINKDSKWGKLYQSESFQNNSVFQYAHFKTMDDLKSIKRDHIITSKECLFIPPDSDEDKITMDYELKLSEREKGGFICVLWRK